MTDARITLDAAALKARVATLEAELAEVRAGAAVAVATRDSMERFGNRQAAHANALRDALEKIRNTAWIGGNEGLRAMCQEALAQTPAASLAANNAEVLERAAKACDQWEQDACDCSDCGNHGASDCAKSIRALAAQAATHSVPDGTSEVTK